MFEETKSAVLMAEGVGGRDGNDEVVGEVFGA